MDAITIKNSESGLIKTLQGGRIGVYNESNLMWSPYKHGSIALPKGSGCAVITRNDPIYFNNVERDFFGSPLSAGGNYDVYAQYVSSTSFRLQLVPWYSDTERLADSPSLLDGIFAYEGMRLLGSIRTDDADGPIFVDSALRRFVSNLDNRLPTYVSATTWGSSVWRCQSSSWVEFPSITRAEFICINPDEAVHGAAGLFMNDVFDSSNQPDYDMAMAMNDTTSIIGIVGSAMSLYYYDPSCSVESCSYATPRLGWNWITIVARVESTSYWCDYHSYDGQVGKAILQIMA